MLAKKLKCLDPQQAIEDIEKLMIPVEKAKALFISQNVAFKTHSKGLLVVTGINGPIEFKALTGQLKAPGSSRFERGGVFKVLKLCEVGLCANLSFHNFIHQGTEGEQ